MSTQGRPPRVVVTGVGGAAGRSLAEQLRDRGYRVVGTDVREVGLQGVATVQVPPAHDPRFIPTLRGLVRSLPADLVIPTVSEELPVLAACTLPGAVLVVADPAGVAAADDKWLTHCALEAAGVPVPRTVRPARLHGAIDLLAVLGNPAVSKPRRGRGGRGVVLLRKAGDLTDVALGADRVVQSFAGGSEYVVDLYVAGDFAQDACVVLEKTELAHGEIGNGVAVRRVDADDIAAVAKHAVAALGLTGPIDVDVRRAAGGEPLVLEVNARFGAHSAYAPEVLDALLAEYALAERRAA